MVKPKRTVSKKALKKWKKMIEAQRYAARNPVSQAEAEAFQREIRYISPEDLLRDFNI